MTDKTNQMVPTHNWGQAATEFSAYAPFPEVASQGTAMQLQLCAVCAQQGDLTPPAAVVMIQGTVYCPTHAA